jgi:SAM-dependent methyltransferase
MNSMSYIANIQDCYADFLDACVCCGDKKIRFWRKKHFQYSVADSSKQFYIYRCDNCGTGFLNRPPHHNWLQAIYRFSGQALVRPTSLVEVLAREAAFPNCQTDARRICGLAHRFNLSGKNTALDVGSGYGFYTHEFRRLNYDTVSINPGLYENQVFAELNGDQAIPVMFSDFQTDQKYGVVLMSQVLEHLLEPGQAISKVSSLLTRGGVFACAVPNFDSFLVKLLGTRDNACLWVPEHVNYFTVAGLSNLLAQHDLQLVELQYITRIPFNALSKRLGLRGKAALAADSLIRILQTPFTKIMNYFGLGIYINLYAVKK